MAIALMSCMIHKKFFVQSSIVCRDRERLKILMEIGEQIGNTKIALRIQFF